MLLIQPTTVNVNSTASSRCWCTWP